MYPKLLIDTEKISHNVKVVVNACRMHGVEVCGVTKALCGDERIARIFADGGVSCLGDSRIVNLSRYKEISLPKMLIRCPQLSEVDDVVSTADVSVNTELDTLKLLDEACLRNRIDRHGVLIMVDLGDLREGVLEEGEFRHLLDYIASSNCLYLYGIGANLNCLSFILPDSGKMTELLHFAAIAKEVVGSSSLVVSGGNSSNLNLVLSGDSPEGVNSLRLGESLLFGRERATYQYLPGTTNDAFILQTSVVEVKEKPSKPWGRSGVDSYGRAHSFEDKGQRMRAILAFGHQDCDTEVLWPLDKGVSVIDSSSDYTVVDVTESSITYGVGDLVEFRCGYHAVARAFANPYIEKVFL